MPGAMGPGPKANTMQQIFEEITARLEGVPALRWVDEDKGQMNFERPPLVFPAALVTIDLPQTRNMTTTVQEARMALTVLLCFDYSGNTNTKTPQAARAQSLAYYAVVEAVKERLQGWGGTEFNPLERTSLRHLKRPDAYKTVQLTFASAFVDRPE